MSTTCTIKVTVTNVKAKSSGKYKGDFNYELMSGMNILKDDKGNIDLKDVTGEMDITFEWGTSNVTIEGTSYPASFYYGQYTGSNLLISEGKDSDPEKKGANPPIGGSQEFTVEESSSTTQFTVKDKNTDGKDYAYCLVVFVDIGDGAQLIDDPKIYNKSVS